MDIIKNVAMRTGGDIYLGVVGAVRTGKSTFINSFLFGRRVLPAFDTPWSAKLTFVEYTDKKPYFEAVPAQTPMPEEGTRLVC